MQENASVLLFLYFWVKGTLWGCTASLLRKWSRQWGPRHSPAITHQESLVLLPTVHFSTRCPGVPDPQLCVSLPPVWVSGCVCDFDTAPYHSDFCFSTCGKEDHNGSTSFAYLAMVMNVLVFAEGQWEPRHHISTCALTLGSTQMVAVFSICSHYKDRISFNAQFLCFVPL